MPVVWPVTPVPTRAVSITATVRPARFSANAAVRPAMPPPITATSTSTSPCRPGYSVVPPVATQRDTGSPSSRSLLDAALIASPPDCPALFDRFQAASGTADRSGEPGWRARRWPWDLVPRQAGRGTKKLRAWPEGARSDVCTSPTPPEKTSTDRDYASIIAFRPGFINGSGIRSAGIVRRARPDVRSFLKRVNELSVQHSALRPMLHR